MKTLLKKEFGLTSPIITYLFIFTAIMAMLPNYPILVVTIIISLGINAAFQIARETHDIDFLAVLPIRKRDIVKSKFIFVMSIQGLTFFLLIIVVAIRMIFLSNAQIYLENPMMNANIAYLGYSLICFAMFNGFFLSSFFKTGYYLAKPLIFFFVAAFIGIGTFEILHNIAVFQKLNATTVNSLQIIVLIIGILLYCGITALSYRASANTFEKMDL